MDRIPATKRWPRIAAYLVLLAAFNLFCFLGQSRRDDVFWLCYSFVTLAFGVRLVSLTDWLSPQEGDHKGLPLVRWYFWGALAAGLVLLYRPGVTFRMAMGVQVMIPFLYGVVLFLVTTHVVEGSSDPIVEDSNLVLVESCVAELAIDATDRRLMDRLLEMCERIGQSNRRATVLAEDMDQRLLHELETLQNQCYKREVDNAIATCARMTQLLKHREEVLQGLSLQAAQAAPAASK